MCAIKSSNKHGKTEKFPEESNTELDSAELLPACLAVIPLRKG